MYIFIYSFSVTYIKYISIIKERIKRVKRCIMVTRLAHCSIEQITVIVKVAPPCRVIRATAIVSVSLLSQQAESANKHHSTATTNILSGFSSDCR